MIVLYKTKSGLRLETVDKLNFYDNDVFYSESVGSTDIGAVTKDNFERLIEHINKCLKENKMINLTGLENLKWED